MIEQGKPYRRKADGAKLLAVQAVNNGLSVWKFVALGQSAHDVVLLDEYVDKVVAWTDPLRASVTCLVWLNDKGQVEIGMEAPKDAKKMLGCRKVSTTVVEGEYDS